LAGAASSANDRGADEPPPEGTVGSSDSGASSPPVPRSRGAMAASGPSSTANGGGDGRTAPGLADDDRPTDVGAAGISGPDSFKGSRGSRGASCAASIIPALVTPSRLVGATIRRIVQRPPAPSPVAPHRTGGLKVCDWPGSGTPVPLDLCYVAHPDRVGPPFHHRNGSPPVATL
jgi:hypothetical protein